VPRTTGEIARLEGLRVLVVDDDEPTGEAIVESLAQTGVKLMVARSAAEAMGVVETFRPEVLICDIAMPGEDGYTFLRRLRALGAARGGMVPAVALTGLAHDEDRDRALAAGFQLHVAKPVDSSRLIAAVLDLAAPRSGAQP
jgi:CheY-like chemotaxis protein